MKFKDTEYLNEFVNWKLKLYMSKYDLVDMNKLIFSSSGKTIGEIDLLLKNRETNKLAAVELKQIQTEAIPIDIRKNLKAKEEWIYQNDHIRIWKLKKFQQAKNQLIKIQKTNLGIEEFWIILIDKYQNLIYKRKIFYKK